MRHSPEQQSRVYDTRDQDVRTSTALRSVEKLGVALGVQGVGVEELPVSIGGIVKLKEGPYWGKVVESTELAGAGHITVLLIRKTEMRFGIGAPVFALLSRDQILL